MKNFELRNPAQVFTTYYPTPQDADKAFKQLAGNLTEIKKGANKVKDLFTEIHQAATTVLPMVLGSKVGTYEFKTGIGQSLCNAARSIVYTYISKDEYNKMFFQSEIRARAANTLYEAFNQAASILEAQHDTHDYANAVAHLVDYVDGLIVPYLEGMQQAPFLKSTFDRLTKNQKEALIALVPNIESLAADAFQHLGRVDLLLGSLQEALKQSTNTDIKAQGARLEEIITAKVKPKMVEINSKLPMPSASPAKYNVIS